MAVDHERIREHHLKGHQGFDQNFLSLWPLPTPMEDQNESIVNLP